MYLYVRSCIFTDSLFNNDASNSGYTVWNDWMLMNGKRCGSGHYLTEGIFWNFSWGTEENNENIHRYYSLCTWKDMNWHILNPSKVLQQLQSKPLIHLLLTITTYWNGWTCISGHELLQLSIPSKFSILQSY